MSLSGLDITLAEEDKFENDTLITVAIKSKEGFLRTPEWDNAQWTWGYGTEAPLPKDRNAEVPTDLTITREQAQEELLGYLDREIINKLNTYSERNNYNWNDTQKEGLTSFLYNLGFGALNQLTANGTRTDEEIAEKMLEYNKERNPETGELEVSRGLTKRRIDESDYFRRGMN
jgi:GH24 family phage-related lysozyme (muramidase)